MKKRIQALRKTPANKIYFSLLGVALAVSLAFWAGQYAYAVHLEAGNGSIQQMMWFSGILFSSLFLGGLGSIGLLFRYQAKQIQKLNDDQMKRMALVQNPDFLAMNAGDLILLLDPPSEAPAKLRQAAEPIKAASSPAPQGNQPGEPSAASLVHSPPTPAPEDGMTVEDAGAGVSWNGVRFLYGNSRIAEVEGRRVYQTMIQDVEAAEREINEIERSQRKRRYRIVSEFAADWNYWQDLDKEMLYVSPACEDISGYPPRDYYKSSDLLDSVIHPEDRPIWATHNQEELAEKDPGHLEFRILTRDGEVRWVSHFCKPVHDHNGKFLGVCGSNRDISTQKRAEEAVEIKTQELLRSNAELEQFAYVASHDLQTPLRAISGYLNLLTKRYEGKLEGDADRFIQRTNESLLRMQRLIHDLLTYSRLTTRAHPFQPTDCNQVLKEVLEMLQPAIEESGGAVSHGPLPTLMADGSQFLQLFQNLIGNALKFRNHRREDLPSKVGINGLPQGSVHPGGIRSRQKFPLSSARLFTILFKGCQGKTVPCPLLVFEKRSLGREDSRRKGG